MDDRLEVRQFGHRTPRFLFPKMVNVEIPQGMSSRVIGTHGIDISGDGIAVAADVPINPAEPVTAVVPLADKSVMRLPGRVLCQSQDECQFALEFSCAEQQEQLERLMAGLAVTHVSAFASPCGGYQSFHGQTPKFGRS